MSIREKFDITYREDHIAMVQKDPRYPAWVGMPLGGKWMGISRAIMVLYGNCGYFADTTKISGPIPIVDPTGIEFDVDMRPTFDRFGTKEFRLFLPNGQQWFTKHQSHYLNDRAFWDQFSGRHNLVDFVQFLVVDHPDNWKTIGKCNDTWACSSAVSNFQKMVWAMLGNNDPVQQLDKMWRRRA